MCADVDSATVAGHGLPILAKSFPGLGLCAAGVSDRSKGHPLPSASIGRSNKFNQKKRNSNSNDNT